ncbi:MAG: hypothetical protein QOJ07_3046, partial [Thermoleophilaceae bacterium]|nr:hypothetical protein [Thermoleophilaceae bacterium]
RRTPAAPTAEAPEPDAPTQAESPAEPPDGGNGASAAPAEREQPAGSKAATDDKASDKPINRRRKKHGRR